MNTETKPNSYDVQSGQGSELVSARNRAKTLQKMTVNNVQVFNKAVLEDMIRTKKIQEEDSKIFRDKCSELTDDGSAPVIKWIKKDNKIIATPSAAGPGVTSVNYREQSVKAPDILNILGIKIDIKSKKDAFIENYKKNYVLARSHNVLMSKFASLKLGFYGMMLSLVGVNADEIRDIQKQARKNALSQNKALFEENEYAGELLIIMGGSKRQMKAQNMVINEVRRQIASQCEHFGLNDHYDTKKMAEVQLEQCKKILEGFMEEKRNLIYQHDMHELGILEDSDKNEILEKLLKINGLIKKTESRVELKEKELNKICGKKTDAQKRI